MDRTVVVATTARALALCAVALGVGTTVAQQLGRDVFAANIAVGALAATALTIALATAIVSASGRPPVAVAYWAPFAILVVGVWGEWAYARGAWALPSGIVYAAGALACVVTGRRRWLIGQIAFYALVAVFAFAGAALSGIFWESSVTREPTRSRALR